ncbi:ANTAR domain-containing protein [Kribbella sp. NPDC048915]|uniref:ANTAR domain-containing protein n=1 Tax=Kribbella sp. NPDC048915 TaxID=3155148 RepID=UPI0033D7D562
MRSDDKQGVHREAAELAEVAVRLQTARDTGDLLTVSAELAQTFFACPFAGVATLGRASTLLDVAGPAAELIRGEAAVPDSAWHQALAGNEPTVAGHPGSPDGQVTHVPLIPGRGRAVGVLSLYGAGAKLTYGRAFATHVAVAMESLRYQDKLHRSMDAHRVVSSSLGMLMERYNIDAREAYDVLSGISLEHNVKLPEIARRVIEDRNLPVTG